MSKHTKEPWLYFFDCSEPATPHPDSDGVVRLGFDDYERARVCVNACRGLPTDELEQKGLVAAVGTQLLELEQQRDGLLVALEELASDVEALMKESGGVYGLHQNGEPAPWAELVAGGKHEEWLLSLSDAVELIAKLKGGAA